MEISSLFVNVLKDKGSHDFSVPLTFIGRRVVFGNNPDFKSNHPPYPTQKYFFAFGSPPHTSYRVTLCVLYVDMSSSTLMMTAGHDTGTQDEQCRVTSFLSHSKSIADNISLSCEIPTCKDFLKQIKRIQTDERDKVNMLMTSATRRSKGFFTTWVNGPQFKM